MDDATRKQKLSEFYNDDAMKEVVKSFLIDTLKSETIERVFKRLEVSGIADAKIAIEKSFVLLDILFGKENQKPKPVSRSR
jgi:hypothetical protein